MSETLYIDIHTHRLNEKSDVCSILSINLEEQMSRHQTVFHSVGIHPWNIKSIDTSLTLHKLEISASNPAIVAIGEIGLDRITKTPLLIQQKIFQKQLLIAEKNNKPVIIHCVKCYSEIISIRKKSNSKLPWIIHGFIKNKQIATDLIALGCYLSFGKALLSNKKVQSVFQTLPLNKLFLETDNSDLEIEDIYLKASQIRKLEIKDLKKELHTNFKTCFNRL